MPEPFRAVGSGREFPTIASTQPLSDGEIAEVERLIMTVRPRATIDASAWTHRPTSNHTVLRLISTIRKLKEKP